MSKPLDHPTLDRLAKLCGLFSSDHEAERAAAAHKADRLLRDHGLTWRDALRAPDSSPKSYDEKIAFLRFNLDHLDDWERSFVVKVARFHKLSEKQRAKIDELVDMVIELGASE